ncbi:hypothetical protein HYW76_00365 [Candidatus Pacearchaeota archaeon]|nr:hypothetical protein [Candidatus Pacearchaeota archaeon]
MKNKKLVILPILFIAILALSFVVSAAENAIVKMGADFVESVYSTLEPYLKVLVGSTASDLVPGFSVFVAKILLLIILIAIIYITLSKSMAGFFADKMWVLWIISIILSVIGVRFLTPEWINAILLPTNTFAIAITAGLPFILYFMIVKGFNASVARRTAWIFFAVIFLILYASRTGVSGITAEAKKAYVIYPITAGLALLMVVLDGTIRSWWFKVQRESALAGGKSATLLSLETARTNIGTNYSGNPAGYSGIYPAAQGGGFGQIGTDAFLADSAYLEKQIRKVIKAK